MTEPCPRPPIRPPITDAEPLAGRLYVSEDVYAEEQERLFSRLWLEVGREEDVAGEGDFLTLRIGREPILVVRGGDGEIRAFYNVCRHRGAELVDEAAGSGLKRIACPYHAWSYAADGRLVNAPLMEEGRGGFDRRKFGLVSVRLARFMGFLFVCLDADAPPHGEQIGDLPDIERYRTSELCRGERIEYEVAANWKILFENYGECYHCPVAHPQLQRVSDFRSGATSYRGVAHAGGPMEINAGLQTMTLSGKTSREPLPGLTEEDLRQVRYFSLYPNFLLALHPDYVLTHRLWPEGPERTRVVCEWLFRAEAMAEVGFDPSDAVEFWDLTNRQDWQLCERTHRGVRSRGYSPGPYQVGEVGSYNFDRWYLEQMGLAEGA